MDAFPSIAPNTRVFVPGDIPRSMQIALSGITSGYRQGNRRVQQSLSLSYSHLTEEQMNLIKTHYINSKGSYEIFFLSSEIWADFQTPPVPLIADVAWRYASEPTITDVSFDRFTVEVELVSHPLYIGELIFDAGLAAATPARTYTLNGGGAAATPARDYVINSGAST